MIQNKIDYWSRLTAKYVAICFKNPFSVLAGFGLIALLSGWFAMNNIRIVTDLAALLPENTPSVDALNESKMRIGSTDLFTIAIQSPSGKAQEIAKLQDILKNRIEKEWDDATWVQVDRDTAFFRKHALYYLPEDKLTDLKNRLEHELNRASAEAMPGMVNLMDSESEDRLMDKEASKSDDIEDWYDEDLPDKLGLPPQVADEFQSFFTNTSDNKTHEDNKPNRLIGPNGEVGVVLVQLKKPSTDLDFAQFALSRGNALISDIKPATVSPDLNAQVVGAYRSFMEVDAVASDGKFATAISAFGVLILMLIFFKSPRTLVAVIVPLAVACSLTMGL
ncbi:MAG: MMPL family transporter, partial [Planctomycetes bacterium]|nr:MMPL family transporter [Planctomycetota bacterium]